MTDASATTGLVIPQETREKFTEVVELILGSESMNDEERQYWINILPVMTPDQLASLKDILGTEKRQLAAIDKKYSKEINEINSQQLIQKTEQERHRRRMERQKKESAVEEKEEEKADELLKEIEAE